MAAGSITNGCLDEATLAAYADGQLSDAEAAQLLAHLDGCKSCFTLVSEVARGLRSSAHADTLPAARASDWQPPPIVDEYRVEERIGQGAVGSVYRAIDTRLDRPAAIKFLAVEPRPAARERFALEARAVARLSHPNVVTVYRAGEIDGRPFLVSQLVRGRSLNQCDRPMPWTQALDIGVGLARGLAAAHRAGVLHRDIKPANAILDEDGTVKLLDFGLAKLLEADSLVAEPSNEPLPEGAAPSLTATGALLGTPLYMAPEAWRGAASTPAMDIYSVGALLHELCVGAPPHVGASLLEVRRKALDEDARVRADHVPRPLAEVIERCLRRDPAARYASADALLEALEAARLRIGPSAPGPQTSRTRLTLTLTMGALVLLLAAFVGARALRSPRPEWHAQLVDQQPVFDENADTPILSPDGKWLTYASNRDGAWRLYRQPFAGGAATPITPPGWGVWLPQLSRDGRTLYFVDDVKLYRMPSDGGARALVSPRVSYFAVCGERLAVVEPGAPDCTHCERILVRDGDSERELLRVQGNLSRLACDRAGAKLAYLTVGDQYRGDVKLGDLWWIAVDGGSPVRLTSDGLSTRPTFHPDGKSVLFSAMHDGRINLWEQDLAGGKRAQLTFGDGLDLAADVAPDGSVVIFDVEQSAAPLYAYSPDGTTRRRLSTAVEDVISVRPTRDGRELIVGVIQNQRPRIVSYPLPGGDERVIAEGQAPALTTDEREIVFTRIDGKLTRILAVPRTGGPERLVATSPSPVRALSVGPDGIVHVSLTREAAEPGVWKVPLAGGDLVRELDDSWGLFLAGRDFSLGVRYGNTEQRVYLARAGAPWSDAKPLPITHRDNVAFVPDERSILYWSGTAVRRYDIATGNDSVLFAAPLLRGFGLGAAADGQTIYAADASSHVRRQLIANYGSRPRPR